MRNVIYSREDAFKLLLQAMNIHFIQSPTYITFYEGDNIVNIEWNYLYDYGINFSTPSKTMWEFNNETSSFLEDWFDEMTENRFKEFLEKYNEIEKNNDLFFLLEAM